ncbi:MAG TPA: site-specific integrase [Xanthobacteraceae bacterium]|nr:site-specific integrase [Xanthobacteraceae bacterium]
MALALQFARAEKSPATRRAYRSDFELFRKWCAVRKLNALPATPLTLATFLASEAKRGIRPSSLERRVFGITYAHLLASHKPPGQSEAVKATMRGIRRAIGTAPNRKQALTAERVRVIAKLTPTNLIGLRDRALLLISFAGAFRRSELVRLDLVDIRETESGLLVKIRASKTDQEHRGHVIGIAPGKAACLIKALKIWLAAAKITNGPIFRPIFKGGRVSANRLSDRSVAEIVKAYAGRIGLDPMLFSAHSLRAGFLTSAAQGGASVR